MATKRAGLAAGRQAAKQPSRQAGRSTTDFMIFHYSLIYCIV